MDQLDYSSPTVPSQQLAQLMARVPLPARWSVPMIHHDVCDIGGFEIEVLGLISKEDTGESKAAAAAELPGNDGIWERTYFDLIERLVLHEAEKQPDGIYELKRFSFLSDGIIRHQDVFRKSADPFSWQVSRTNGVSAFSTFDTACQRSAFDLWKQDAVLRSWYGGSRPLFIHSKDFEFFGNTTEGLRDKYDFRAFKFCHHEDQATGFHVVGVFSFPLNSNAPFSYGYGAGLGLDAAIAEATRECIQRIGFLWGEKASENDPLFSPSPDYHLAFFRKPAGIAKIQHWLSGSAVVSDLKSFENADYHLDSLIFIDLTPPWLMAKGFVVKAIDREALPLVYGTNYQALLPKPWCDVGRERLIHPIV